MWAVVANVVRVVVQRVRAGRYARAICSGLQDGCRLHLLHHPIHPFAKKREDCLILAFVVILGDERHCPRGMQSAIKKRCGASTGCSHRQGTSSGAVVSRTNMQGI